jgi:hypothetical protein
MLEPKPRRPIRLPKSEPAPLAESLSDATYRAPRLAAGAFLTACN